MECQPCVEEPSPSSASPPEEPLETVLEPSEPVKMKPRARKKKLAVSDATSEATKEDVVQPLLDPLFWAALLNTHNRLLKSKKQEQYTNFRLT